MSSLALIAMENCVLQIILRHIKTLLTNSLHYRGFMKKKKLVIKLFLNYIYIIIIIINK